MLSVLSVLITDSSSITNTASGRKPSAGPATPTSTARRLSNRTMSRALIFIISPHPELLCTAASAADIPLPFAVSPQLVRFDIAAAIAVQIERAFEADRLGLLCLPSHFHKLNRCFTHSNHSFL